MGQTTIDATHMLGSRGMLMAKLPADSTAADAIRIGEAVELSIGPDITVPMKHAAVELALPVTGPPCDVYLGLVPYAADGARPFDLDEIARMIASRPDVEILLLWSSPAE